jgi:hypothetical protein
VKPAVLSGKFSDDCVVTYYCYNHCFANCRKPNDITTLNPLSRNDMNMTRAEFVYTITIRPNTCCKVPSMRFRR